MSASKFIKQEIQSMKRGKPFTGRAFSRLGSRSTIDTALSRLVKSGLIERATQGVYFRPEESPYIPQSIPPSISSVISLISKESGEVIQDQGAKAANALRLSTQVPVLSIYWTSGLSRNLKISGRQVTLKHVSNRKLQLAGTKAGSALSALWYLGEPCITVQIIKRIEMEIGRSEFESLEQLNMPAWMRAAFNEFNEEFR